jgi:hypothetical protein
VTLKQWQPVNYIGPFKTRLEGNATVIDEVLPGEQYKIQFYALNQWNHLVVPEHELEPVEQYVYRWVSGRGPSSKHYTNRSIAKGQATINNARLQRALVDWEDCP